MVPYEPKNLPLNSINWARHVSLIAKANAALGYYNGILQGIVNPGVLLSPMSTHEAVLSSRIEGTQASMEEVLKFEANPREHLPATQHADIQEIINYRHAIGQAVQDLKTRPLCLNIIKKLHVILLNSVRGKNKSAGNFRRIQNFIGPLGSDINNAIFVPPSADRVEAAMDNWEKYLHFEEKDRLVQMAIVKAQFELIHPFLDGNGRIGRMIIPLFLFEKKILSSPMFYLSEYLEEHRDIYYGALLRLSTENDWDGWITFFLSAIIKQAESNSQKTKRILELYEFMKKQVPRTIRSQYVVQAIDTLFAHPIFSSTDFITHSEIPKDSAIRILNALKKGEHILDLKHGSGRRASVMIFPKLMAITENTIM